jgi:hypothetical protein
VFKEDRPPFAIDIDETNRTFAVKSLEKLRFTEDLDSFERRGDLEHKLCAIGAFSRRDVVIFNPGNGSPTAMAHLLSSSEITVGSASNPRLAALAAHRSHMCNEFLRQTIFKAALHET